jgi:glycerophosphoryl diester phosphodiesterase
MEMDVQLTKDGVPVVFHDFKLARVARDENNQPVDGKVYDYTLEQLQHFHLLNSNERIPTFEAFLDLLHGQEPVIVELKIENSDKELAVCPKADALLSRYNGPYCIESFNPRGVKWYKDHRPEIMRGQLSSMFTKTNADAKKYWFLYFISEYLMLNFITRPDFIAYDAVYWHNLSRRLCHDLYKNTAVAWTIRSQEQLNERNKDYDVFIFEHFTARKDQ